MNEWVTLYFVMSLTFMIIPLLFIVGAYEGNEISARQTLLLAIAAFFFTPLGFVGLVLWGVGSFVVSLIKND